MDYITTTDLDDLGYNLAKLTPEQLADVCKTASIMVDKFTLQTFSLTQATETQGVFIKDGWLVIFTDCLPVVDVTKISLFTSPKNIVDLDLEYLVIDTQGGCVRLPQDSSYGMVAKLTYSHGYTVIPDDVVSATKLTAVRLLESKYSAKALGFSEVSSIRDGAKSISKSGKIEVPEAAKQLLNNYVRVR